MSIQIQPELDLSHQPEDIIELSRSIGRFPEIDKGEDNGAYVNLNYFTEHLPLLWQQLHDGIFENPRLGSWVKRVSIVICEGDFGWDDYLLLHHFNPKEKIDVFEDH